MKRRLSGIVALSTIAVSLVGTGGLVAWRVSAGLDTKARPTQAGQTQAAGAEDTNKKDSENMDRLYPQLIDLARPRKRAGGGVSFEMLSFSSDSVSSHENVAFAPAENFTGHVVTMAYISSDKRLAVIDGKLYQEGDILPSTGGTLRTITPQKVLIAGREVRQWIEVHNPDQGRPTPPPAAETTLVQAPSGLGQPLPTDAAAHPQAGAKPNSVSSMVVETVKALKGYSNLLDQMKNREGY